MQTFTPGTKVHCAYRENLIGVVIPSNDPRIWTNTLAFRDAPTQAQVDNHIAWITADGMNLDKETAVDYGDSCFRWDSTNSLSAA